MHPDDYSQTQFPFQSHPSHLVRTPAEAFRLSIQRSSQHLDGDLVRLGSIKQVLNTWLSRCVLCTIAKQQGRRHEDGLSPCHTDFKDCPQLRTYSKPTYYFQWRKTLDDYQLQGAHGNLCRWCNVPRGPGLHNGITCLPEFKDIVLPALFGVWHETVLRWAVENKFGETWPTLEAWRDWLLQPPCDGWDSNGLMVFVYIHEEGLVL